MSLRDDAFLASPFRLEWASPEWCANERVEAERGVALAAASVLRSARFVGMLHDHSAQEAEVRVWLETDTVPLHVAVWWEEARGRFWFAVVDSISRERVALVVFESLPCVTAEQMLAEDAAVLEAVRSLVPDGPDGTALSTVVDLVRHVHDEALDGRA